MKRILSLLLLAPAAFAADLAGRFAPGTKYEAPAVHAPANVSRMYARAISRTAPTASVDLPAAGGSGMIIWTIPARRGFSDRAIATRLTTPSGAVLQPGDRGSMERGLRRFSIDAAETKELDLPGGRHEVVHVMRAAAATYRLAIDIPEDSGGVMVVAAEPESSITLSTWAAPLSRQPGEPITLHAELRDGDAAIFGARVSARFASPTGKAFDAIELSESADGVYTATLADLPERTPGAWQVRFDAEGLAAGGSRFARTGAGELVAERGSARLGDIRTEVVADALRVTIPADVAIAGAYRLDVIVSNAEGLSLAWAEGARNLRVGSESLQLDIPLEHLDGASIETLSFDARLLGLDHIGVAARTVR
jgi:hypothetical protein